MADTLAAGYVLEAALLTSPIALKVNDLVKLFNGRLSRQQLLVELGKLAEFWNGRGLRLVETAEGWRFQSAESAAPYLLRLSEHKPPKYSRAVLETLAIIAYRQPATRGDIEEIRGVAVNPNVLRQLEERGWIEVVGHRETPGRPELLGTTQKFLSDLGLKKLEDLPPLSGEEPTVQEFELVFADDAEFAKFMHAGQSQEPQTPSAVQTADE